MKSSKKDDFYFLMHDILSCFPDRFEDKFLWIINQHLIAKEATRRIFKEEVNEKKPKFNILMGCLILQNTLFPYLHEYAIYEVIEVCKEIDYCFRKDKRKRIKSVSSDVILKLFFTIYLEFIMMSSRREEGKPYVNKFKTFFSREDLISIMQEDPYRILRIMQGQGLETGTVQETGKKLKKYLDEFYC